MNSHKHFRNFIFASLLIHICLFAGLFFSSNINPVAPDTENVEISFIENPEELLQNRILPIPTKVVESDLNRANDQLSENAKYLSDRSNTVEQQTRARSGMKFHNSQTKTAATQKAQKPSINKPAAKKLFGEGFDAYKAVAQQTPPRGSRATAAEASTTNDNLEDAKDDLITRLNTREYKYAGYYHRIKEQLNQWWVPKVQEKFTKLMQQGRTIASTENKVTSLIIVLNDKGNLVNVQLLAASGVRDLDDAAVEAFRSAAPFPNPPKGMIESDGNVRIRWDCVVES